MREVNISIEHGDMQKIAGALAELSGVVAVHTEQNRITAFCGDRMNNDTLMNVISKVQSSSSDKSCGIKFTDGFNGTIFD